MSTSTPLQPKIRAAFERLIDYAGLFPPAKLDMHAALAEYESSRNGPYAWMLGRFVVPASRIEELLAQAEVSQIPLSVIVDAGSDARAWFGNAARILEKMRAYRDTEPRISIEALEVPLPPLLSQRETYEATIGQFAMLAERHGLRDLPTYVELPRDTRFGESIVPTMASFARYGVGAKLRCGGVVASAVPSVEEVATFLAASGDAGVSFKATAGLHHPLRHFNDAAGFTMHGFLNILTAAAQRDASEATLVATLLREDARDFDALDAAALSKARQAFIAYGSCSFSEPVDDLVALSILPKA
ncbi:MAG: hypothetical protein JO322_02040 [Candidatus Eremiobacteraeota bacterium]|nr:hypothetical protein [Candidatus Eremiobacteraeota bacterium]